MIGPDEICRARNPIHGLQCQLKGEHGRHRVTVGTIDEFGERGVADSTWLTCDKHDERGRPCLRVLRHTGDCTY